MKTKRYPRNGILRLAILAALPLMMGACPQLRDDFIGAFETAVRTVINAGLDEYFNDFRDRNF